MHKNQPVDAQLASQLHVRAGFHHGGLRQRRMGIGCVGCYCRILPRMRVTP